MSKLQAWFRDLRNDDIVSPLTGHEVEPPFFDPVRKRRTEVWTTVAYIVVLGGGLILSILFPPEPVQEFAREMPDLVFFMQEGPGGGGGGSGEAETEPPSLLQIQGEDQANIAMAVEVPEDELVYDDPDKPNEIEEEDEEPIEEEEEEEIPEVIAPVVAQAPDDMNQLGDIEAAEGLPQSTGSGTGTGVGAGQGSGIGPGTGGGFGGGAYRPGSGVTTPIVVKQVTPQFTNDALARKITGEVVVEVIILKDGTVRPVRVVEGLSPDLNTRALEAAAQWKFIPGKFQGQPVDVIVDIVINFNIL